MRVNISRENGVCKSPSCSQSPGPEQRPLSFGAAKQLGCNSPGVETALCDQLPAVEATRAGRQLPGWLT